ncbi:aldehyde dehydrogenase family protein [Colwellia sp. C1TZA3]|uniref:aldehyde dehydrogenase family protein n=1 Tax=Colwellia sp. C1TZA3 TaxID=2508879 RepID=UPI0011BA2BED|nr:aldehyde dehydrogenase family protein [Colwellia sp. C1TZA3]TWX70398.1 aldehyde dehydrogenase family protein [Colwellia sp. C1TZA3]
MPTIQSLSPTTTIDIKNSQALIQVLNPEDGSLVGTVVNNSVSEVDSIIEAAVIGAQKAKKLSSNFRMTVLNEVADNLSNQKELFAQMIAREGIKTINEARKEVSRCVETIRISAEEARRLTGETIAFDQAPGSEHRFGYYRRIPLGVVAAITPFNDPLNLVAHKIGPAIAAGNSVILLPHHETPLVAKLLVELFNKTDLPQGILNLVTGYGVNIGDMIVSDPRINMVSFTGGKSVGERILSLAGLKKISMELGSNCPAIVMNDANVEMAMQACVSGAFGAAGQNCLHVQRIFIQDELYEQFAAEFCLRASQISMGDKLSESTQMGPMINNHAALKLEAMVQDALEKNSTLLCGGKREGNFFQPTVFENVSNDCLIAKEEVFGPITVLYRFSDKAEAIAQANDVEFGLQAGIFTNDLELAFELADSMDCGGVMINDSSDYRIDAMPFGGVKGSGVGREGVMNAVKEMTDIKTYCFNLRK